MANLQGFDAHQIAPSISFEPLPAGKYLAAITASELKPTKSGTGEFLQLTFQVLEGPHQGRLLWSRLNLQHPNPTVVQIARAELSAICRGVGVLAPQDSSELHNLPLLITVRCQKRPDTGEICNEISGYQARVPQDPAVIAATPSVVPPWKRGAAH